MSKIKSFFINFFPALIVSFLLVILVYAWTAPSAHPPSGNVPAPINVGTSTQSLQTMEGSLIMTNSLSVGGGLLVYGGTSESVLTVTNGNVGIGTTTPTYKLHVEGGNIYSSGLVIAGTGLCIGSSSNCITSFQQSGGTGGTNYWASSGNNIYNTNSGNVGIGTTRPAAKLSVIGARQSFINTTNAIMQVGGDDVFLYIGALNTGSYAIMMQAMRSWDEMSFPLSLQPNDGNVGIGTNNPQGKLDVALYLYRYKERLNGENYPRCSCDTSDSRDCPAFFPVVSYKGNICYDIEKYTDYTTNITYKYSYKYVAERRSELIVLNNGNIGIGTPNPQYKLQVGEPNDFTAAIANEWLTFSSIRWKENIKPINNALDKVIKLRGVYFDWKNTGKHDIGLIAEEVGKIIPEVVEWDKENPGYATSLSYEKLVPVLLEAIKEQQKEIEELKKQLHRF